MAFFFLSRYFFCIFFDRFLLKISSSSGVSLASSLAPRGSAGGHCPYGVLSTSRKHFFTRLLEGTNPLLDALQTTSMILVQRVQLWEPRRSSPRPASRPGTCCSCTWDCVYAVGANVWLAARSPRSYFLVGLSFASGFLRLVPFVLKDGPLLGAGWKELYQDFHTTFLIYQ